MKLYRMYIYIDPDGDFSFKKSDSEWFKENTLEFFFRDRSNAGQRLYDTLNEILTTLSENTPDYFKKSFKENLIRQKELMINTDLNVYHNEDIGNYTFNWGVEEIEETPIKLKDTNEELNILKVEV